MWLFWYCIDDHLSALLEMPGLGQIPFWIWCLLNVGLILTILAGIFKAAMGE